MVIDSVAAEGLFNTLAELVGHGFSSLLQRALARIVERFVSMSILGREYLSRTDHDGLGTDIGLADSVPLSPQCVRGFVDDARLCRAADHNVGPQAHTEALGRFDIVALEEVGITAHGLGHCRGVEDAKTITLKGLCQGIFNRLAPLLTTALKHKHEPHVGVSRGLRVHGPRVLGEGPDSRLCLHTGGGTTIRCLVASTCWRYGRHSCCATYKIEAHPAERAAQHDLEPFVEYPGS